MSDEAARFAREYIERVIEQDYGTSLDELTALMLLGAGPVPPLKPYSVRSEWKSRAHRTLTDYVQGREDFLRTIRYADVVVRFLCRRKSVQMQLVLSSWEVAYMHQIKAARRKDKP